MANKILFLCGGAYISGMEVVTLHLMNGLKQNGYEVQCIFSGWNDGSFKKKLDEIGIVNYEIKIGWIYIRKPFWTIDTLLHYPKALYDCNKIIKKFKPDIFQFCNFSMSIMLYRFIGKKSVYNLQEDHTPNIKNSMIFRMLNKKMSVFTAVSSHIVKVLEHLSIPNNKIKLVYNGIPPIEIDIAKILDFDNKGILNFAIIGQVALWKGHLVLIDAIEHLVANGTTNFKLLIYGNYNTDFASELKKAIKKKKIERYIEWQGFVNMQKEVYANCDVVVVPSLSGEPCSLTIIESMARGKALIVSDRGGNPELVQHKVNGMIFNATDAKDLSNCMQYLISNNNSIADFGAEAKKKAEMNYTNLAMTASYIELYKAL